MGKELHLTIDGLVIPYIIEESTKISYIKLVMGIDGLKVVKAHTAKLEEVEKILDNKSKWIRKHHLKFQSMKMAKCDREWKDGEKILFRGREYNIKFFSHKDRYIKIDFDGDKFNVFVGNKIGEEERIGVIESVFKRWLKEVAGQHIRERLNFFCNLVRIKYNGMKIKEQKTRWGSCSKRGNLNFNWKLIMSPDWVIDYVVLHEVCHLVHMNHSKDYWAMVERYMPDYKKAQNWLKEYGVSLGL